MKEKKTAIITIRCTETTKQKLEEEAERYDWSVSQLAGKIIADYTEEREKNEFEQAKKIFSYIKESQCTSLIELTQWALENNCNEEVKNSLPIWKGIFEEIQAEKKSQ